MRLRHSRVRVVGVALVIGLPLLGISGVAAAKAAVGSAKWCAAHPKLAKKTAACNSGSTGKGTGGDPPSITVQIDPNPVVETGSSSLNVVVQVETSPSLAGDDVSISSSQLFASCDEAVYLQTEQTSGPIGLIGATYSQDGPLTVALDDDGNVTVEIDANDCAPGTDVIEADLEVAPYYTALGTLTVSPPVVTTAGVYGYPTTSGIVTTGEVETGDSATSGDSDVYAEQPVEISDNQLVDSCGGGSYWWDEGGGYLATTPTESTLDDDGNAVFVFWGASCAATTSDVVADVLAGTHPTYTTTFTVVAPQPTI